MIPLVESDEEQLLRESVAAIARAWRSTSAPRRASAAIQVHGGNGVALEHQLANYFFIVRMLKMGPVSKEMILNFVAERTLGLPRSY